MPHEGANMSTVDVDTWEDIGNVHINLEDTKPVARQVVIAELAAKYGKNGKYLDLGCGRGDLSHAVKRLQPDARLSVADAYQQCLDLAASKFEIEHAYRLSETEFAPDKVINERFDVVMISHVLEHIQDPLEGIRSVAKLLKPDGVAIVVVPNLGRPELLVLNLLKRHYVNRGHVVGWDPSHFRNFLGRIAGLEIVEEATDHVSIVPGAPGRFIARTIGRWLGRKIPWWGGSIISVVRNPQRSSEG
jgi:2-polyprenyl-3-methyl-5-hydroxy-6-metoxy-1,4-benzoquinol methylase